MCGIAGYARPDRVVELDVLEKMAQQIWRRGPDEGGFYRDPWCGLAIRRLSVMDPQDGHQPVHDEQKRYHIVYNGEIYNFKALREGLKGHTWASRSDTEVIPHAWEEEGPACVQRFNGMFAFAVWDREEKRLWLFRDRLGIKPLHYAVVDGVLVFGSELKSILAYPGVSRALDLEAFDQYLTYDYIPGPRTIFRQIRKVLPGQSVVFDSQGLRTETWWTVPRSSENSMGVEEAAEELRERLRDSVGRMLVADVPLGLFLSGGVDSSTLVALAVGQAAGRVKTFSIGFADRSFDESKYARLVSQRFGTDHYEELLRPQDLPELVADMGDVLDEPMADASLVPTYLLSRLCRRHVTVALSGEGGDELFGGYPTYQAAQLGRVVGNLPPAVLKTVSKGVERLPVSTANLSLDFRLKRFFRYADQPADRRHILWVGSFGLAEKAALLLPHVRSDCVWEPLGRIGEVSDPVETAMRLDTCLYLPDDLLVKLDRASMAVSLEGRVPFLDHTLVEWACRLPRSLKVDGYATKVLLKKAVEPLLPPEIVNRPKKGFGIPVARWLKSELRELMHETLSADRVRRWDLVDATQVGRLIAEHEAGTHDHRKALWSLMVFSLWHARWASG